MIIYGCFPDSQLKVILEKSGTFCHKKILWEFRNSIIIKFFMVYMQVEEADNSTF